MREYVMGLAPTHIIAITYVIWAGFHLVFQLYRSLMFRGREKWDMERRSKILAETENKPKVTIIVPSYNEDPRSLKDCLQSLVDSSYENKHIVVVDDKSPNIEKLEPVYTQFEAQGVTVMRQSANKGKRHAQDAAYSAHVREGFVITVDSDTQVDKDSINHLVGSMLLDEKAGASTGFVLARNKRENLLTRIIDMRYWFAFAQERGAQAYGRAVACCSGPFTIYRLEALKPIWNDYVTQTFGGKECTFGDDRHLTNLILQGGHNVNMVMNATANTDVPTTMAGFAKQQLRWARSFFREMFFTPWRRNAYTSYDLLSSLMLPVLLMTAFGFAIKHTIEVGPIALINYGIIIALVALIRSIPAMIVTKSPWFLVFVVIGLVYTLTVMVQRFVAVFSLKSANWMTRG